ncbi:KilA-N domain-containing protein [Pantoea sp. AS-PWVM4]|uniref:KilA-N domain-containing protein n=1 Tax=Pantoea sp. AS-PWVM4 TaxID=1332069 RepID=UPI000684F941|nr:KilA-N domain-containing protein [Pantoea sp. AS-PWVM4]
MSAIDFYSDLNDAKGHLHEMADAISSIKVNDENSLLLRDYAEENVSLAYCILEELLHDNNRHSNELIINGVVINKFEDKLYCANDLHKASGNENRHRPQYFLSTHTAKTIITSLPGESWTKVHIIKGGSVQGTYACRELLFAYAMWINPELFVRVLRELHLVDAIKKGAK